jgi:hypothetical protein
MEWEKLRGWWSHMVYLPPLRDCSCRVDILIGLDHASLITACESRYGRDDKPTASKTWLEWTLQGAVATITEPILLGSISTCRRQLIVLYTSQASPTILWHRVVRHLIQVGLYFGWTPESGDKVWDGNGKTKCRICGTGIVDRRRPSWNPW